MEFYKKMLLVIISILFVLLVGLVTWGIADLMGIDKFPSVYIATCLTVALMNTRLPTLEQWKMWIGYMTPDVALKVGFTHHGKYFGIPIWITDDPCPMVCAKWAPCELLISTGHVIEGLLRSVVWPDAEPCFLFWVGDKISI